MKQDASQGIQQFFSPYIIKRSTYEDLKQQ